MKLENPEDFFKQVDIKTTDKLLTTLSLLFKQIKPYKMYFKKDKTFWIKLKALA